MRYLTILNFENRRIHQYELENSMKDFEEFIVNEGFSLNGVQWMAHNNGEIIKEKIEQ